MSAKDVYNRTRLRNLKRAKLKQKEAELQLLHKHGADQKEVYQTMKDINKLQRELNNN